MTYKVEYEKKHIPKSHDLRVKLSTHDKEEIKRNELGESIATLAKRYGVSRRTIQFTLFPERLEACKQARKEKILKMGGNKAFYSRYDMTGTIRRHRQRKQTLNLENILV